MSQTIEGPTTPTKIANRSGLTVGELVEFLQRQDQSLPVASECGCQGGWSSPASMAYLDTFTAVNTGACVKIGWGDE